MGGHTRYTMQEIQKALAVVEETGNITEAAERCQIPLPTLFQWVRKYQADDMTPPIMNSARTYELEDKCWKIVKLAADKLESVIKECKSPNELASVIARLRPKYGTVKVYPDKRTRRSTKNEKGEKKKNSTASLVDSQISRMKKNGDGDDNAVERFGSPISMNGKTDLDKEGKAKPDKRDSMLSHEDAGPTHPEQINPERGPSPGKQAAPVEK